MDIQKIPASRLNAAAYNPRKDLKPGDREYEKLKRSIAEFGYVEPVIWNRQTGNVVGGHQRITVARDHGIEKVPVTVVDLEVEDEKALNIVLNKVEGEWDEVKLKSLLDEIGEVSEGEETWPCGENHRPGEFCYCGQNEYLQ